VTQRPVLHGGAAEAQVAVVGVCAENQDVQLAVFLRRLPAAHARENAHGTSSLTGDWLETDSPSLVYSPPEKDPELHSQKNPQSFMFFRKVYRLKSGTFALHDCNSAGMFAVLAVCRAHSAQHRRNVSGGVSCLLARPWISREGFGKAGLPPRGTQKCGAWGEAGDNPQEVDSCLPVV